jgi:hypothetical protein
LLFEFFALSTNKVAYSVDGSLCLTYLVLNVFHRSFAAGSQLQSSKMKRRTAHKIMADLWDGQKKSQNLEKLSKKLIAFAKQNGVGCSAFAPAPQHKGPAAVRGVEGEPGNTEAA